MRHFIYSPCTAVCEKASCWPCVGMTWISKLRSPPCSCGAPSPVERKGEGTSWAPVPSSGKGRRVRLTQRTAGSLRDHRKRQVEERMSLGGLWQDQDLVFPNGIGSLLNPSNLRNRSFKRIKARSGVREELRFHDLRHTFATMLLSTGVHAKVVSEMLGHASITITLDTNSHVLPEMQDSAAQAMEAALRTVS